MYESALQKIALVAGLAAPVALTLAQPASATPLAAGQITAHWEELPSPTVFKALRIDGMWHAAGEVHIRVDGQADASAYSLNLRAEVDRATQFNAIEADTSAVPHLEQVTTLVNNSSIEAQDGKLGDLRAAAYQIAIWHFTNNLRIKKTDVPSQIIRSDADRLIHGAITETDQILRCTGSNCRPPLSTAATTAALNVRVGSEVNNSILRIAIITPIDHSFNRRQYVDIRINGLGASICPGETDLIRVDKPITHNVLKSSCEFRSHDPDEKGPRFAELPRILVERKSTTATKAVANNIITALIPRQDISQEIQVNWPFSNGTGMTFMPSSPSSPLITASAFDDSRTSAITIDPADFSSFQEVIQQTVLPFFTSHGIWGLALLLAILLLLLVLKEAVVALAKLFGRIIQKLGRLAWAPFKKRLNERKSNREKHRRAPAPPSSA